MGSRSWWIVRACFTDGVSVQREAEVSHTSGLHSPPRALVAWAPPLRRRWLHGASSQDPNGSASARSGTSASAKARTVSLERPLADHTTLPATLPLPRIEPRGSCPAPSTRTPPWGTPTHLHLEPITLMCVLRLGQLTGHEHDRRLLLVAVAEHGLPARAAHHLVYPGTSGTLP